MDDLAAAAGSSSRGGGGGGGGGGGRVTSSPLENSVNKFVRAVALIERLGHTFGTLVFTWATVVLLGGYPTVLGQGLRSHFYYVVLIVSLEALRMFNRENSVDYQIFFRRDSVNHIGWNGLIIVAWVSNVLISLVYLLSALTTTTMFWKLSQALIMSMMFFTAVIAKLLSPGALRLLPVTVRRFISLISPVAAVLLLIPSLVVKAATPNHQSHIIANWVVFTVLLVTVFLLTVSRLDATSLGNKYVFWRRLALNGCMFAELVLLVFINDNRSYQINIGLFQIYALLCVSFGNMLMPAAFIRVKIAVFRFVLPRNYGGGGSEEQQQESSMINLEPSLDIFYTMVLGQGILHLVSCTLEMLSFLPRRSLARQGGFRGQLGSEAVNLYYEYAMEKCLENNDFAARIRKQQMSLGTFAIHSISSESPKLQVHGVWMMYNLLREEPSRTQLLSKLHRDANAIARLINMLEWRSPEDATIRLFAAKITASAMIAGTLRVISIPGAMQAFSALLDADSDGTGIESQQDDSLPGLALSIFDSLASNGNYDFHNTCLEISKAAEDIIPKIIQFTSSCYRNDGNDMQEQNTNEAAEAQRKRFLMESALQLLGRLSSISGKMGVTLRHELMEYPTLLTNLSAISADGFSTQKARKLAVVILSNLTK